MIRSRLLQAWRTRFGQREDPMLMRFGKLEGYRNAPSATAVPVFFARRVRLS
jgi:hypothetical protein